MSESGEMGRLQPVSPSALSASPEVVAAIAAAVEAVWPRRRPAGSPQGFDRGTPEYVWRFSGRWWSKPVTLRRDRPWAASSREHGQIGTEGA